MKYLLFFLILFTAQNAQTQKLHGFLFCKTGDANPVMRKGTAIDYSRMRDFCQKVAHVIEYEYVEHTLTGIGYTSENLRRMIKLQKLNDKIGPDDIVIIYYSTHGVKTPNDNDNFPRVDVPNEWIPATEIHDQILRTDPKFQISVIDACSNYKKLSPQEAYLIKEKTKEESQPAEQSMDKTALMILFSKCKDIIISAAQPGYKAIQTDEGSIFTTSFLKSFEESIAAASRKPASWESIFKQTKLYTQSFTTAYRYFSWPIWSPDVCYTVAPKSESDTLMEKLDASFFVVTTELKRNFLRRLFSKTKWYNVSLSINSSKPIDSVIYLLHYTMPQPRVTLRNNDRNANFDYRIKVWGEFPIKAIVHFSEGKVEEHYAGINFILGEPQDDLFSY